MDLHSTMLYYINVFYNTILLGTGLPRKSRGRVWARPFRAQERTTRRPCPNKRRDEGLLTVVRVYSRLNKTRTWI